MKKDLKKKKEAKFNVMWHYDLEFGCASVDTNELALSAVWTAVDCRSRRWGCA